jgi:IS5 family transposase
MTNLSLFDFEPSKTTSRARFFEEIEPHLPIEEWKEIIRPIYYPDSHLGGRAPKPLEIVLRTYLVQNFFSLSDEGCEDAVVDIHSVRKFVGITTNDDDIPDKSTICRFRNLLIEHNIQQKIFDYLVASLTAKGLIMRKGTIVDSTIIECSTSKRNRDKARAADASWTKKAGNFKHGYKIHNGVDKDSGLITSNKTTTAKAHDVTVGNDLLHGDEEEVLGDSGYLGIEKRRNSLSANKYRIMKRPSTITKLPEPEQTEARAVQIDIAKIRAKVEHAYNPIKRIFGYKRTLYKGLKKNAAKNNMICALANIWLISRSKKPGFA